MAKIECKGIEEYMRQLNKLADSKTVAGICKYAAYDGAAIAIEAIKAAVPVDTGDLRASCKLTHFYDDDGYIYTKVIFDGYDSKGTPNAVKARVLESGSSKQQKKPFIRPAINKVKTQVTSVMQKDVEQKLNELMKG